MSLTTRASIEAVMSTFKATGTKPPKAVVEAEARADKLKKSAAELKADGDAFTHAVSAALVAGRDPYTDKAVIAALVSRQMHEGNITIALESVAIDELAAAITESADAIVEVWRAPFDEAAAVLAEGFERIGDRSLDDSKEILGLGGDIAEVWTKARTATQTIDKINNGWTMLGDLTRRAPLTSRYRVLRMADAPPQRVLSEFVNVKLSPWEAVTNGLTLSLPTFDEYREREAAVANRIVQAEQEYEQAGKDAFRATHGMARV